MEVTSVMEEDNQHVVNHPGDPAMVDKKNLRVGAIRDFLFLSDFESLPNPIPGVC